MGLHKAIVLKNDTMRRCSSYIQNHAKVLIFSVFSYLCQQIRYMADNKYKLQIADVQDLIKPMGYCIASDRITVDGEKVGFMYREEKEDEGDSGWRFLAGDETDEYLDDTQHFMMFDVNYIANLDPAIIPALHAGKGSEFERVEGTNDFRKYEE